MFRVTAIREKAVAQIPRASWEKRTFPSCISGRSVMYSEPSEFHMGAYSWKLSLFEGHRDVTNLHAAIDTLKNTKGFQLPENFSPWNPDGNLLAIPTWKSGLFFYDVLDKRLTESPVKGFIQTLCWSSLETRYVVVVSRFNPQSLACLLSTQNGESVQLNVNLLADEQSRFWWIKDRMTFIGVYRDSKRSSPIIELFDGRSGISLDRASIDPEYFVPYDSAKYRGIPRNSYSLETSASSWCVGYFLDTWHDWYFDGALNQLSLAIYRPAGEPLVKRQQAVLPVVENWCTLQLEF